MITREIVTRHAKDSPNFIARFNSPDSQTPFRAYVHKSEFKIAFKPNMGGELDYAESFVSDIILNGLDDMTKFNYVLAAIWGDSKGARMLDFIGFSGIDASVLPKKWPGNPNVSGYVFRNNLYVPEKREISCGDGMIIWGIEESYRRTKANLEQYLRTTPDIPGLDFSKDK
jgi:hypothetical protein